eukprot:g2324.t1
MKMREMLLAILLHVMMLADYAGGTQTSPHIPRDPGIVDGRISLVPLALQTPETTASYAYKLGCTDITKANYDPVATTDDGSCISEQCSQFHSAQSKVRTFTSTSHTLCDHMQGAGLINGTETKVWCPRKDTPYEYYQISIKGSGTKIGGIIIQGDTAGYVTKFAVSTWTGDNPYDYTLEIPYAEMDSVREFTVNTSSATMLTMRHTPAAHIRIYPLEWVGRIRLSVDIISCTVCGDGFLDVTEECDDGNLLDGDGCSGIESKKYGLPRACMQETRNGAFWCEPKTDGGARSNPSGDCLYKTNTRMDVAGGTARPPGGSAPPQKRFYADEHYNNRDHCSTGDFNSGILPLCDGEVCDGQIVTC